MPLKTIPLFLLPLVLIGCIADQKSDADNNAHQSGATIVTPQRPQADAEDVSNKVTEKVAGRVLETINASTTNTQASMQGLINLGVSKLTDTFKAVEANLSDLIKITMNNQMTANASLQNKMDATVVATNRMEATLSSNITMQNQMRVELKNDMKAYMDAKFSAMASAQIGAFNKMQSEILTATAGRDVNYLPKAAVDMVLGYIVAGVIGLFVLAALGGLVAFFLFKSAMAEARNERDEKMRIYNLLNDVLVHVPADKQVTVRGLVTRVLSLPPADHQQ